MKNTLIIFTVLCSLLICALIAFYFVSPAYEVNSLRSENNALRTQMASLQADNTADLLSIVVFGMISITALLLGSFFMFLCLLANKRPVEFFRLQHNVTRRITQDNTETRQAIQHNETYDNTGNTGNTRDFYMMEV